MTTVGRAVWYKKATTKSCCRLDMSWLARQVKFDKAQWLPVFWGNGRNIKDTIGISVFPPDRLRFRYTSVNRSTGQKTDLDYHVFIESTPCHYGGKRWWFICPHCHRRCRIIYLAPGFLHFVCRICGNLTYESQQEGKSMWWPMFQAIRYGSGLESKYYRSRSRRKRAILKRKLDRIYGGMQSIINWGKKFK